MDRIGHRNQRDYFQFYLFVAFNCCWLLHIHLVRDMLPLLIPHLSLFRSCMLRFYFFYVLRLLKLIQLFYFPFFQPSFRMDWHPFLLRFSLITRHLIQNILILAFQRKILWVNLEAAQSRLGPSSLNESVLWVKGELVVGSLSRDKSLAWLLRHPPAFQEGRVDSDCSCAIFRL